MRNTHHTHTRMQVVSKEMTKEPREWNWRKVFKLNATYTHGHTHARSPFLGCLDANNEISDYSQLKFCSRSFPSMILTLLCRRVAPYYSQSRRSIGHTIHAEIRTTTNKQTETKHTNGWNILVESDS